MSENPLDKLIVEKDVNEISLDVLASILQSFVRLTKEGELLFERSFYELPEWKKVTIYLLSRKVISIKKLIAQFDEGASPKEISEVTGVPSKSISRDLSTKLKTLVRNEKGKYKIPHYNIHKCAEMLK
jgi:hypothetical protein